MSSIYLTNKNQLKRKDSLLNDKRHTTDKGYQTT
jgi:hypothetical protein